MIKSYTVLTVSQEGVTVMSQPKDPNPEKKKKASVSFSKVGSHLN